ncbi:MAG: DUF4446 family protein [Bacteroidales bacterium]|nr:DUF4446 family protein [Candidatus Latescibacterota bacterium]
MENFINGNIEMLVLTSTILSVVAVITVMVLLLEVRKMRKPFIEMADLYTDIGTEKALEKLLKGVDENREFMRSQSEDIKMILARIDKCYSGTGIVKYNAFEDIGGMQSYSLCILTSHRNGVILTNLVGRNSTRGYALEVKEGSPSRELSEEEKESLKYALRSLGEK